MVEFVVKGGKGIEEEEEKEEKKVEETPELIKDLEIKFDFDFIKDKVAKRKTLIEQDREVERILETKGEDPRHSFRVVGIEPKSEENSAVLNIVTSGEEGEEKAKEVLGSLKKYEHVSVKNESAPWINVDDEEVMKAIKSFLDGMERKRALDKLKEGDEE